jgi:hypothetical protein
MVWSQLAWRSSWHCQGPTRTSPAGLDGNFALFKESDVGGLGDTNISRVILNWNGDSHVAFSPTIIAPTEGYKEDRILNSGRNYWSFDVAGAYTRFDPKLCFEVDLTLGIMFNATNPATNYHTGTEFRFDWPIGEHFSDSVATGVTGYDLGDDPSQHQRVTLHRKLGRGRHAPSPHAFRRG